MPLWRRGAPGAAVAPQAGAVTLIRRVTYNLTGLPPTPKETFEFVAAWKKDSESAWVALIDRLLASPHYGEQMACIGWMWCAMPTRPDSPMTTAAARVALSRLCGARV